MTGGPSRTTVYERKSHKFNGEDFSCQAPHQIALLFDSSLTTLLIDFTPAQMHESLAGDNYTAAYAVTGDGAPI